MRLVPSAGDVLGTANRLTGPSCLTVTWRPGLDFVARAGMDGQDNGGATGRSQHTHGRAASAWVVPPQVYQQVGLGIDAEALVERLLPAQPVDPRTGEPGAAAGALVDGCLHYPAAGRADLLYRFCFEDDRLVRTAATSPS